MNDLARFNAMRECRSTQWVRAHTAKQWGEELGVGSSVVERIRLRMTYKWVTDDAAHRG